jgi:agmatinase
MTTIFGAPFDGTTTYRPGTRFGPAKIRQEFFGIETFSPFQRRDLADVKYEDEGDLELPFGNTGKALSLVESLTASILAKGQTPLMLGGEHLVTLGAFRAVVKKFPDVCVVHFDAHADLREDYLGEPLSHSTVLRRIYELTGKNRITQFGIRSGTKDEFEFIDKNISHTLPSKKNVYLTIDLDVLDPAEFPGTGTPEAGGYSYNQLLAETKKVFETCRVVAVDIVELSPPYDPSGISTALACKFLREILLFLEEKK